MRDWIKRSPRWGCRLREWFEDRLWALNWVPRRCCFVYDGIGIHKPYRGVYVCHCGARMYGLACPIVVRPGETVEIHLAFDGEKNDG